LVRIQADPQDYPAIAAIAFVATGGSAATPTRPGPPPDPLEDPTDRRGADAVAELE
jgi:hypothetical protein